MKLWFTILCGTIALNVFSQKTAADFSSVDYRVQFIKKAEPAELAKQLTSFCNNDIEKVRAIFKWISENISYQPGQKPNRKEISLTDDDTVFKSLDERIAESVLKKGFALCEGYSRLFKVLCMYAGIHAEVISGYGRVNRGRRRFGNNHTWNAVLIDSEWKLLDVTWASGFTSWSGDNFIKSFNEEYFLSSPAKFIGEHYPDDPVWALMDDPPLLSEFRHSPFKQKTFAKYKIVSYRPSAGIIEAVEGDTLQLEIKTADAARDRTIGSDPFIDINTFSTLSSALLSPSYVSQNTISYSYCANSAEVKWLYIGYNNDVIMKYRLIVKAKGNRKELAGR